MVGIVLVSHSYALAEGAKELSLTMAGPEVKIAAAGGLDMDDHSIGTDPMRILEAIQEVYSEEGVLIFVDMGSALLSSELAWQFLEEDQQKHVLISDAPFIEGAITAAVQARLNSSLPEILAELKSSLQPKQEQLKTSSAAAPSTLDQADSTNEATDRDEVSNWAEDDLPGLKLRLQLKNAAGLHARPAAKIAGLAAAYPDLEIWLRKIPSDRAPAKGSSLNSLTLLGLRRDDLMEFSFFGPGAEEAKVAMRDLAAEGFGDGAAEAARELAEGEDLAALLEDKQSLATVTQAEIALPSLSSSGQASSAATEEAGLLEKEDRPFLLGPAKLQGLAASPGIVEGPAHFWQTSQEEVFEAYLAELKLARLESCKTGQEADAQPGLAVEAEGQALTEALAKTKEALRDEQVSLASSGDPQAADIFEAHLLMLEDPLLAERIQELLAKEEQTAAEAWHTAMVELEQSYQQSESEIIRERAADVRDLRWRLLTILMPDLQAAGPGKAGILLAEELGPGDLARLDKGQILGICTAQGSPSSHAAVIARSRGIPAIMGLGSDLMRIKEGTALLLDATGGLLYLEPKADLLAELKQKQAQAAQEALEAAASRHLPALTKRGQPIAVFANIGSAADARQAVSQGAEGVGLLRTEFIYLNRSSAPSEEEQLAIYREIAQALEGRPLTLRTLDAGGDKPIPYLHLPPESNPFLGYRAIRISLQEKELFRTQLRAALRTASDYPLRLMFPMIASLEELREAKAQLALARQELEERGLTPPKKLPVGMMIEIPAAALQAADFAREVDFFSLGTNDLTQYTLAAERGNTRVAKLYSPLHPAVIELIYATIKGAHQAAIPVAVCGDFAADPQGIAKLVELGVDELSVNPISIPAVKQGIRRLS
ncbi:MAG: phosphoenolpyruvate--protein phosphotransferase [Eubacteriales bacterium]|nr:phosphoenolpyruvate--protein phosphotransferase [Eubacteriales bacterium]